MNLRNESTNEKGNRHQIRRLFHPPIGQVAVATLLGPLLPFRFHVSSHNRNNLAGHRNRLHGRGTTYSIDVYASQCSRFISEEVGWDRACGGGDDQRNTPDSIMLWLTYLFQAGREHNAN